MLSSFNKEGTCVWRFCHQYETDVVDSVAHTSFDTREPKSHVNRFGSATQVVVQMVTVGSIIS